MKEFRKLFLVVGCISMMFSAAGCANKDIVKKEEPITSKQTTNAAATAPATKDMTTQKKEEPKIMTSVPQTAVLQPMKPMTALEKIYFDFDSSDLSKASTNSLSHNANILLKEQKDVKVRIEGNCDERGSAEYNLALGERRAKAAAKYLKTLGVQPDRLTIVSYGKEKPAVQGNDESAWSKNRRDEFIAIK